MITNMNRTIVLIILSLFFALSSINSQTDEDKNSEVKGFNQFLKQFTSVELPINYKRVLSYLQKNNNSLNPISLQDAKRFLDMSNQELFAKRLVYDHETFEKSYVKEKNLPASHLKFNTENFVATIYRHSPGIESDTVHVYLRLFTKKGEFLDEKIIGEQFTRENDWISSVFLDENHFKLFRYRLNLDNYEIVNNSYQIKNDEKPLTLLVIEDYEIDGSGNIKMIQKSSKKYLQEDITTYKVFNPKTDDPMNKY
jgi:hypothetical protein